MEENNSFSSCNSCSYFYSSSLLSNKIKWIKDYYLIFSSNRSGRVTATSTTNSSRFSTHFLLHLNNSSSRSNELMRKITVERRPDSDFDFECRRTTTTGDLKGSVDERVVWLKHSWHLPMFFRYHLRQWQQQVRRRCWSGRWCDLRIRWVRITKESPTTFFWSCHFMSWWYSK